MLPLATNRSTAAQKGTMLTSLEYGKLSGAARKAALVKLTSEHFGTLTPQQRGELKDIAVLAFSSESEAMKNLATKLKGLIDCAGNTPHADLENGPDGSEAEKKDTPVTTVDFAKLEVAVAAEVATTTKNDGKADLGRNLRDRHPEIFAKAK